MGDIQDIVKNRVYSKLGLQLSSFTKESESKEYQACRFKLNDKQAISRLAKITPKKSGQFVTFWKREHSKIIEPFDHTDLIDFFIVNIQKENKLGQFVFPKSILIQKGILSTDSIEGKRAFRVYPPWDTPTSKQAEKTQKWQLNYFYEIGDTIDFDKVKGLYNLV